MKFRTAGLVGSMVHNPTAGLRRSLVTVRTMVLCAAVPLVVALTGCPGEPPPKVGTSPPTTTPTVTSAPKPPSTTAAQKDPEINLSKDIMDQCNISIPERQPKFDFDSTNLSSAEKEILDQVGKCLATGPLKGRNVKLVGRADPRGEQEYNMNLGENRANSVKRYLANLGVEDKRMSLTSRGALDASGTDEEGWRKDRRVDIGLQ